jgi:hypothetical protein
MTKKLHSSESAQPANPAWHIARQWRRYLPLGLTFGLARILRAENHVDYRYEYYDETGDRMKIETHSVYFEQKLSDAVVAKGELVYDGISGATPNGILYNGQAAIQKIEPDLRRAANLELDWKLGNQTLTPGFAWSKEHDYLSYGISLNDAIEFNDKNTILKLGASHNFDSVRHADKKTWTGKDSTEFLIGVSQLLSPKDILEVAFTFGNDSGYLSDPYRFTDFQVVLSPSFSFDTGLPSGERRPSHRNKEILFTSLTHHFDSLDASLEGSYRFYNDSYGVVANTVGLTWHQWLGKHFIVEPMFRAYEQSAASFYSTAIPITLPQFSTYSSSGYPNYNSSDYRLSNFYSLDCGLQATAVINDHIHIVAGYHRYEMNGLDHTPSNAYPTANVFTAGFSILW